jgi:hypothetical protein
MNIKGVEPMQVGDWVKTKVKQGPHIGKQGYILSIEKAYDGYGLYRAKVALTSDSKGNLIPRKQVDSAKEVLFMAQNAIFYDHEIEILPDAEIKQEHLINLSLDIESEPLFRLLTAEVVK